MRSGRTLKPMTVAFETTARSTSDSVIPPTPRWTNDSRTSSCSWSSLRSASVSASSEPCTSALTTRLSVATSPRCTIAKMSSRRAPPASIIGLRSARRLAAVRTRLGDGAGDLVVRARRAARRRRSARRRGRGPRPASDGPGFGHLRCRARRTWRGRGPTPPPATIGSPTRSVPRSTSAVTTGPRPWSRFASSTHARAGASGSATSSSRARRRRRAGSPRAARRRPARSARRRRRRSCRRPTPRARARCSASCWRTRVGVGVVAVDLGDRHDDRHLGRAGVVDRLDRLRHDAVVGRDDEHRDVGGLRAAARAWR